MTLLLLALTSSAFAAPALKVTAERPLAPAEIAVFEVDRTAFSVDPAAVQALFGLAYPPVEEDVLGGLVHLSDLGAHGYVLAGGGVIVHDLAALDSFDPVGQLSEDDLLASVDGILADLGLDDDPLVTLVPAGVGDEIVEDYGPDGRLAARRVLRRSVHLAHEIDGLPTFGGGAETELVTAAGGRVAAFLDGRRVLDLTGYERPLSADAALRRYAARLAGTSRWNVLRTALPAPEWVEIRELTLGYYAPEPGASDPAVEPVWCLGGQARGRAPDGRPVFADVLWFEPALGGHAVPSLGIDAF